MRSLDPIGSIVCGKEPKKTWLVVGLYVCLGSLTLPSTTIVVFYLFKSDLIVDRITDIGDEIGL